MAKTPPVSETPLGGHSPRMLPPSQRGSTWSLRGEQGGAQFHDISGFFECSPPNGGEQGILKGGAGGTESIFGWEHFEPAAGGKFCLFCALLRGKRFKNRTILGSKIWVQSEGSV